MKRRAFIALAGATSIAWSPPTRAQRPAPPVIGFLSTGSPEESGPFLVAFRDGLKESGHVEGRSVALAFRWAEGRYERLAVLAAELIGLKVSVIAASGGVAAQAARQATTTIPVVFVTGGDPVETNLVASLRHPRGNATGITFLNAELTPKRLELLRELVPHARSIAYLSDPVALSAVFQLSEVQAAARASGLNLEVVEASTAEEIERAFARLAEWRPQALLVGTSPLFGNQRVQIIGLAGRHAIPAIYHYREFAAAGGLISYGASPRDAHRTMGVYVGKILNGTRPADLPVQQPTRFELVINLKTARALGLVVSPALIGRADEVIE